MLGEVGQGYRYCIDILNEGRIGIGAQMIGLCRGALDCTVPYLHERIQFGQPIWNFQVFKHYNCSFLKKTPFLRVLPRN